MQAFCPRCDKKVSAPEEILLQKGVCSECDEGQLYIGPIARHKEYSDFIAVNFVPGSHLAVPLEPTYHITNLETFDEDTDKINREAVNPERPEITHVRPFEVPQTAEQTDVRNLHDIELEHRGQTNTNNPLTDADKPDAVTHVVKIEKFSSEGTPVIHPKGNQRDKDLEEMPTRPVHKTGPHPPTAQSKQIMIGIIALIIGISVGLFVFKINVEKNSTTQAETNQIEAQPAKNSDANQINIANLLEQGIAAYESADFKLAITIFQKIIKIEPNTSEAQRNLGITFARLNQYDNAVKHYRAYLKLTPNAPDAEAVQRILSDYDKAQSNR